MTPQTSVATKDGAIAFTTAAWSIVQRLARRVASNNYLVVSVHRQCRPLEASAEALSITSFKEANWERAYVYTAAFIRRQPQQASIRPVTSA